MGEAFEHVDMLSAVDDAFAHVDMLTAVDDAFAHVDMLTAIDEAFDHVDMLSAIDDAFDHVDMLSAIDEAFEPVDMLSSIDDAFAHIDTLTSSNSTDMLEESGNIDELLAALPSILAEIDALNVQKSSTDFTAIFASAGALLAIGAGFVIKNKFSVLAKKD